jgi:hypothetical protein
MYAILIAGFFAVWGLPSSTPNPSEIQANGGNQTQPTEYQGATSPHPSAIATPSGDERQDANQYKGAHRNAFLAWCKTYEGAINLLGGVAVALFTAILTIYTIKLWKSGEEHSERELRAYITIPDVFVKYVGTLQPIQAVFEIKNSGQTPAYDLRIFPFMSVDNFPSPNVPSSKHYPTQTTSALGPGEKSGLIIPVKHEMNPADTISVIAGTRAIYVGLEIWCWDIFRKQERCTRYSGYWHGDGTKPHPDASLALIQTKEGNQPS